ncbi:MAG: hypothetical protein WCY00_00290 [Candidatus Dojkabacteria bacterium]|jgi:dihydroorotate dehydrogenase
MDSAQQSLSSLVQDSDLLEEKLKTFTSNLQNLGFNDEQIETLVFSLSTTSIKQTLAKISALMNDEEFSKWKDFVDSGANSAQQLLVLNKFLLNKTNKDLETINSEIMDSLIKDTLEEIVNTKDLHIKISQLSEQEIDKAKELLEAGDYEGVDRIINGE